MIRKIIAGALAIAACTFASCSHAASSVSAIVVQDQAALRAAPRDSAQQQAVLWQGELVEVRGERMDYLQVWDYKRERGGFVRASQVRRTALTPADAPELISVVRFVRETPGSEALGIGLVAAYLQAAPAEVVNSEHGVEALDALGTMADRLARRASSGASLSKATQAAVSAHLEVAGRYGVRFTSFEREGRMQICYDGEAFRRVLAMKSGAEQRARAALGLTRQACVNPDLAPAERRRVDEWRADVLERVDAAALPAYLKNRVMMARAGVWASLAYQRARKGEPTEAAANRAIAAMGGIDRNELPEDDLAAYNDAVMRVSASRWAALANVAQPTKTTIATAAGQPGETCIALVDEKHGAANPLVKRCTYGIVWANSATLNRESNALAVAVQQTDTWRELWIFRKDADGWSVNVLPPTVGSVDIGYAEFAGWAPGGRQILVAREARSDGKYRLAFELMRLDTLTAERQASDPTILGAFQRWQDPSWKRLTLSTR